MLETLNSKFSIWQITSYCKEYNYDVFVHSNYIHYIEFKSIKMLKKFLNPNND